MAESAQPKRIGLYPGTFDPITNGHIDIIRRGSKLVDQLVVAVAENIGKSPLFDLPERVAMVEEEVAAILADNRRNGFHGDIVVRSFGNLLMHFAEQNGARFIIRGLRAISDFEYEFQMVGMNLRLNPGVETVFLMASDQQQFISSRLVKEIAALGGQITEFVSPRVVAHIQQRLAANRD